MSEKFEDLMRVGMGRNSLMTTSEEPPDVIRWVNLLSALGFTMFCTTMSEPQIWADGVFFFLFYGMIFGPVIFMMIHGFSVMAGGKTAWWVSVACLTLIVIICGYFLLARYGLSWLF